MNQSAETSYANLEAEILRLSRQDQSGGLSPWFADTLHQQIETGIYSPPAVLEQDMGALIGRLVDYRENSGLSKVAIGMSGGVDSALTAALFKEAGWQVFGYTMPILQDPSETERGVQACRQMSIEHAQIDLTAQYQSMVAALEAVDPTLRDATSKAARVRNGNIRARLRMITLYNQAHSLGGLVASTDNFSELSAGFWTINGDVGDLAPIQSLLKSWEVPWMARVIGIPDSIWKAKPTDGLGIDDGDEAQIGATYLQWDITVQALMGLFSQGQGGVDRNTISALSAENDPAAHPILKTVETRLRATRFKRSGPQMLPHPREPRFELLSQVDRARLTRVG
ncbi:NAD(+) synthase [Ruegeria lacuscaerulensis]|uniref:NAD(+) synthase n=1 Tax=Ruegeria lacuscaerulensis TaxID=55218 RepID=UPI00147EDDF6|nr:NAD(+) synthase [Ruegeria lacuscaerulensis]